ncbi:MAG: hypothetical protein WC684_00280 [Hyphomicrobium sp.]|jgi:hypothetical protein
MRVFLSSAQPPEDFAQVLDSVFRSARAGLPAGPVDVRPKSLHGAASNVTLLGEPDRRATPSASLSIYMEHRSKSRAPRVMKPADPQSVANELKIAPHMTFADLGRLRRAFALANHPDRAAAPERENATHRMMIANMLIDREMQRRLAKRLSSR